MRSSSSRSNISRQRSPIHHHHHISQTIEHPSRMPGPHEKFILLQFLQAILFTIRTSFLIYDLIQTIINKFEWYTRFGQMLGGSATTSEKIYTISLFLIAILLISMIVFTFVYNYLLVHENVYGIIIMSIFLLGFLCYNFVIFGQNSFLESTIICFASSLEIIGLFYLLFLIKNKKEIRIVQQLEQKSKAKKHRHNRSRNQNDFGSLSSISKIKSLNQNSYMECLSPSPPSIVISGTDDDDDYCYDGFKNKIENNQAHNYHSASKMKDNGNHRNSIDNESNDSRSENFNGNKQQNESFFDDEAFDHSSDSENHHHHHRHHNHHNPNMTSRSKS
ncbi:hypothetical protein NH340_JMT00086 [Sarcoptes scabiei]|nr:hypothetical protein NH340_JMT00086 [Sarcoptes scabiei]